MDLFENILSVSDEEIELELRGFLKIPWLDYWLNPRRLRGSDFLMRWSQGVWSEHRLREAVNETERYYSIPYGLSGVAPHEDVREYELYFARLDEAGISQIKRPDLLIFKKEDRRLIDDVVGALGGLKELPFKQEEELEDILNKALIAVECENSLWKAEKMPDLDTPLRPQRHLSGKNGLPKNAVVPTVIIKDEDMTPLLDWQAKHDIPIHIWHVFYDRAYGISLDEAKRLIESGLITRTKQTFQAPGGATTTKYIFKIYYHYAYTVGVSVEEPSLEPAYIEDRNGHILPYVKFKGGRLRLDSGVFEVLEEVEQQVDDRNRNIS
jgi:hypothetical protein